MKNLCFLKLYYLITNDEDLEYSSWEEIKIDPKIFERNSKLKSPIHDVCFANTSGRSYQLLGIASDNGTKLLKIKHYVRVGKSIGCTAVSLLKCSEVIRWSDLH